MRRLVILRVFFLFAVGIVTQALAATPVQIIAHAAVPVDDLPKATLRAIFSARVNMWSDDTPVTVYVLPDDDTLHRSFSKDVLGIYPYVLRDTWDRVQFTGAGRAPIQVTTVEELIRKVSATPGAIGYSRNKEVGHGAIKVLAVK